MATKAEAEKIRAMREKGTISEQQAEELLRVLDGQESIGQGPGEEADRPAYGRAGHRHGRRWRGGNTHDSSRVDQPEGEDFEFDGNRVSFSKLFELRLLRSRMIDNHFSASTLHGAELADSTMQDTRLIGASLQGLVMEDAELRGLFATGSKLNRLALRGRSTLCDTKIAGCNVTALVLEDGSRIADTLFAGANVNTLTLAARAQLQDSRFSGCNLARVRLEGSEVSRTRMDGDNLADLVAVASVLQNCTVRGVNLGGAEIRASRIVDSAFHAVWFQRLHIEGSVLEGVRIRNHHVFFHRPVENLRIVDAQLTDCEFVDCTFRDTTFQGLKAAGLRLRGVDLAGRTVQRPEELEALARGQG